MTGMARRWGRLAWPWVMAALLAGCGILGGSDKPKTPTLGNRTPILSNIATEVTADPSLASVAVVLPPVRTQALPILPLSDRRG